MSDSARHDFAVIIPARYASTRLPGKPLLELGGKPMVQHVVERGRESGAAQVVVATDDARIEAAVKKFGGEVVMTRADHESGTDRLAEVVEKMGLAADSIVVNVQGDEPDMPAALIRQVADALAANPQAQISTACVPISDAVQWRDPNVVKVVRGEGDRALYFSRTTIPFDRDAQKGANAVLGHWHLGIYAYRADYLAAFSALPPCQLEQTEKLEQLRALNRGDQIICVTAVETPGIGIDTPEDYQRAKIAFL